MAERSQTALELHAVTKSYPMPSGAVEVLRAVDLHLPRGVVAGLVGPSGSGKTTLLQIAGLLDSPSHGEVRIAGVDASHAADAARTQLRGKQIGFVYQFHHLLQECTALENVMMPLLLAGVKPAQAQISAQTSLAALELGHRLHHRPAALSGGEQQRVAVARALVHSPALLLADEPTGNLDPHTAELVFAQMLRYARETGLAALIATHHTGLAAQLDVVYRLEDGRLVRQ